MSKGTVLIVSGPSGSGKDTILKEVFKALPDIKFSISSILAASFTLTSISSFDKWDNWYIGTSLFFK